MWRNDIKCKYMFMFPQNNIARKGLIKTAPSLVKSPVSPPAIHRSGQNYKSIGLQDSVKQNILYDQFRIYPFKELQLNSLKVIHLTVHENQRLKFIKISAMRLGIISFIPHIIYKCFLRDKPEQAVGYVVENTGSRTQLSLI